MAVREQVIIARILTDSKDIRFETIKKVLPLKPKTVLTELANTYNNATVVKQLFEVEEKENVEEFVGKDALLENADLFNIQSVYIYGFKGKNEWLHLSSLGDKKLRPVGAFLE